MSDTLESMSQIDDKYEPNTELIEKAHVKNYEKIYKASIEDPMKFWENIAKELEWFKPWEKIIDWNFPWATWFKGGKTNIVFNALDRHIKNGKKDKVALYWEAEDRTPKKLTYGELYNQVNKFGNALRNLGVKKGDRITIYLPRSPEQVIAMLGCAKIGAVHSVVYSGFSAGALKERLEAAQSKVVITSDGSHHRGKVIKLKNIVDDARQGVESVKYCIVTRHCGNETKTIPGDIEWTQIVNNASNKLKCEEMNSDDMLFILYTSGTTGKPKGVVHAHGGYQVGVYITAKWIFDLKDNDIFWCTADPGWITGHSYLVYGPLINGASIFFYEGAPDFPEPDRWWSNVERYGVSILYATPTAIRALMKYGDKWPKKHNLSSLRLLGSVGEPINPEAWTWFRKVTNGKLTIMDTWWQTETGMVLITPFPSTICKPGSASRPFPGVEASIIDKNGNEVPANTGGNLIIKKPWPSMMISIYNDPTRYEMYWKTIPGVFYTGDTAKKDKDGYFWIMGRADDVLKVSGYRIGPAEIESSLVSHPAIVEAAVIGKTDQLRGEIMKAFVILKQGYNGGVEMINDLKKHVRSNMGPICVPSEIEFLDSLPKTRSGKIMRRLLRAKELGLPIGDTSTLED